MFQILVVIDMSSASAGNVPGGFFSQVVYAEKTFNHEAAKQWSDSIKSLSFWFSAIYVIVIFGGQRWMRSRPPFKLKIPLFLWNSVLSVFSIFGAFRTVPELYNAIVNYDLTYSVCDSSFYHGSSGFWAFLFNLSKAYELGDTLFIVLRRQPLIFLHWYHHVTVMIYTFYSYPEHISSGRWYITMNYCIHSVMYTYFALRAVRFPLPSFVRVSVTSLQIVQMAIGLITSISVIVTKYNGGDCHQTVFNAGVAILLYSSYLVLFVHFFYQQYAAPAKKKSSKLSDDAKKLY